MKPSRVLVLAACLAAVLATASCGKKGRPDPVPGGNYPTTYPTR